MLKLSRRQFITAAGAGVAMCALGVAWGQEKVISDNRSGNIVIDEFTKTLDGKLHFDDKHLAFCTHYSWIGLSKADRLGLETIYLFYGRRPATLSPKFLTFKIAYPDGTIENQGKRQDLPLRIEEEDGRSFKGTIAFADSDILCYHASLDAKSTAASVQAELNLPESSPRFMRHVTFDAASRQLTIRTRSPKTDARDPDPDHALTISLIVPAGIAKISIAADGKETPVSGDYITVETDGKLAITFTASKEAFSGREQTFVTGIGEGPSAHKIEERVLNARHVDSNASSAASRKWLSQGLGTFSFDGVQKDLRLGYAKAVYQILSNTKAPRGRLARYSVFPNRWSYCSHYLWDSCFTNLGTAQFNQKLAEDFMLALCDNQEKDGKIPHFVCATWNRPGESQPPLIGWSSWRLYEQFGNKKLIQGVYEPLSRMVDWWFKNRDADGDGVVEYSDPLESGWDDSPRFDKGRIAGVDLNAYLNREMRILAKMAPLVGKDAEAEIWEKRAAEHGKRMMERLFDRDDGIFYDRLVAEDKFHKVLTPASFTPLWAEVKVPKEIAHEMIAKYLVNPKHFFGSYPFPVVAYSDPNYSPDRWWRGPVWMNIAWVMTEVLRMYGFEKERKEAISRLTGTILRGDQPNELYSSADGKPRGCTGYCWTSAVFIDWAREP